MLFLNSHVSERDVTDGPEHTIYVGEKRVDEGDLGWMSGTRATLRNAGTPINQTPTEAQVSRRTKKTTGRAAPEGNDVSSDLVRRRLRLAPSVRRRAFSSATAP